MLPRVFALALLVGCTEQAFEPEPEPEPEPSPDPQPPAGVLWTAFVEPAPCLGGELGSPSCPLTSLSLQELGVEGLIELGAQQLGSGMYLTNIELTSGVGGLHVEGLRLLTLAPAATEPSVSSIAAGDAFDLAPETSAQLGAAALVGAIAGTKVGFELTVLEPLP